MLVVAAVKAQVKVGHINNDTAYIEWMANDEVANKELLRFYQLMEADIMVLQSTGANRFNKKWVAAYKLLQTDSCDSCQPVYHIVGKSEGLFRIGKWYGNIPVATIKKTKWPAYRTACIWPKVIGRILQNAYAQTYIVKR